ncbi:MAG: ATP-binding protein, partial [Firmicutes bacterium]|nr:ATP-binding protein [Bacillota bacterium]
MKNSFHMEFSALSENEAFARLCISAFLLPCDPTVNELTDIKTAVSEAVTNAIIHGYKDMDGGMVT